MATGKLGYAWDRLLVYGKGGGAWVGTSSPGLTVNNVPASFTSTGNNNSFGATVGLGVEWAFADNWSARAEWDAILLQNQSFTVWFLEPHSAPIQLLSTIAALICSPPP